MTPPLARRALAEFLGTGLLVVVVGSGIMATNLSHDVGLQLLANSTATVFGLTVLILVFGPVPGAHFNPVVTLADYALSRRTDGAPDLAVTIARAFANTFAGIAPGSVVAFQVVGAAIGVVLVAVLYPVARHDDTESLAEAEHVPAPVI